jgi:uncharacterized protein YrrD
MRKGKDIIGKPVVCYDSGEKNEKVVDLIFDQDDNRLLGFLLDEGGWFSNAKVLPLTSVQAIGVDAVIIPSSDAIVPSSECDEIHSILNRNNILNGTRIMTTDGRDLGTLVDFFFDEKTGVVEGYEASGGLFADAYSGRSFVPAPQTLKIGEDIAFVPAETAQLMEEQIGGLKSVMQSAGEKLQVAGDKLQETAQITGEKLQETAQIASEKLQEAGQIAGDKLQETAQIAGDKLQEAGQSIGHTVADLTVEQAQGRRSQQMVYSPEGYVIVAQGQIVTPRVIDRAKTYQQEAALLESVGLSTSEAAKNRASTIAFETGERLRTTTTTAREDLQEGASNLWNKVKDTASDLQERSTQAIDEKRIQGALGRPTTRAILALNDEVILDVGELITHKAIDRARSIGILPLLLDSVYTVTPELSLDDLRAAGNTSQRAAT